MNLDLIHVLAVYRVVDFVPAEKKLLYTVKLEVHTVYQRFLTSWQKHTPKDISYTRSVQARIKIS